MLRLFLSIVFLALLARWVWSYLRTIQVLKREHKARYNRDEWEKIKRQLEK